jgi:hypothetical protein
VGRRSSPDRWPFYRSTVGWFLPWVLIAAVAGTAAWVAVDAVGRDEDVTDGAPNAAATSTPSPSSSTTPSPEGPGAGGTGALDDDIELITKDVTVQVLNASSASDAGDVMAQKLGDLGFEIVVVTTASSPYTETTVFWSRADSREVAVRLASRFGWVALPKPGNLSGEVSIHVVVGEDEA